VRDADPSIKSADDSVSELSTLSGTFDGADPSILNAEVDVGARR